MKNNKNRDVMGVTSAWITTAGATPPSNYLAPEEPEPLLNTTTNAALQFAN